MFTECRAFPTVLWLDREERRNKALDLPRVEFRRWDVNEIKLGNPRTHSIPLLCSQLAVELEYTRQGDGKHAPLHSAPNRPLLFAMPPCFPAPFLCPISSCPLSSADPRPRLASSWCHIALICLPFHFFPPLLKFAELTSTRVELHASPLFLGNSLGQSCAGVGNLAIYAPPPEGCTDESARPVSVWGRSSAVVNAVCVAACLL